MENFIAYNPTKLYFGKDIIKNLQKEISGFKNILLIYGKGSIKKYGIYEQVVSKLGSEINISEYKGIKSNPVVEDVERIVDLYNNSDIDAIIAIGGGSVIDSAKLASVSIKEQLAPWKVAKEKVVPTLSVPLITVLTIAATGTEMNPFAVVQNSISKEKIGFGHHLMFPKASFLDPQYTISVPEKYTMYGITDIIAHCLESYFGYGETELTDQFIFSIINEAIELGPKLLSEPLNYHYRERMMWAATCALNGMTLHGKKSGEWGVHDIGHIMSVLFDTPHGASLSIAYPAWMKLMRNQASDKIKKLGKALFNSQNEDETIEMFENFFRSIKCPVRLDEINIYPDKHSILLNKMIENGVNGNNYLINSDNYKELIKLME